jgi:hypothetical protein
LVSATSSQISEAIQFEKDNTPLITPSPTDNFQTTTKQEEDKTDKQIDKRKEGKGIDRRKEDKETGRQKEDMVRIYNPPTSLNSRQITPSQSFGANGFQVSFSSLEKELLSGHGLFSFSPYFR